MQPKFTSLYGDRLNEQNQTIIELDFGERVMYNKTNDKWADLSELFTITYTPSDRNFTHLDMLYDVNGGRLYIIADIAHFTEPLRVDFDIAPGAVTDMVGNPSEGASHSLTLWPKDPTAALVGSIMSGTFLSSTAAFTAFSALGMMAPQSLINLVGRANSLYWMGSMGGSNMPESFRSFSDKFEMVSLPWK